MSGAGASQDTNPIRVQLEVPTRNGSSIAWRVVKTVLWVGVAVLLGAVALWLLRGQGT